jgi:hypothetical protein
MAQIIMPKTYIRDVQYPVIFLAGPIRGAPPWQDEAIRFLISQENKITIINPNRTLDPEFFRYIADGEKTHFHRQRAWERHYLHEAGSMKLRYGCVMFWLPGEEKHDCRKSYGAMTRTELGQWMTKYAFDNSTRMCVGTDGKFSEIDTILYDLSLDAPGLKINNSLEETCFEALEIALKRK